jgi:hypothetical protein
MLSVIDRVMQAYTMICEPHPRAGASHARKARGPSGGHGRRRQGACGRGASLFAGTRARCAAKTGEGINMTDTLGKRDQPDRSKINLNEVRYWTKHLNISKEELLKAIDKVGNSAAAVRKELAV